MFTDHNPDIKRYILKLALPAIAGLSTQMIVSLVDTAMVGRIPEAKYALAAMGLGVMATWALISFFSSLSTGTHVLVARRFGEGNFKECGDVLNTSLLLTFAIGIVVALAGCLSAYSIAHFFAADVTVGNYAGEYLFYRFMGIPFFLLTVSYRGFYFGIGKIKIFMFSGVIVNLLNIFFNYIFIYGEFGAPRMGLAGAGLGSTIATICDSLFYFIVSIYPAYRRKYKYFRNFGFSTKIVRSILNISLPVSFQNVFIMVGFLSFVAITGLIGTAEQAATQVVVSTLFISFMPCFGFGIAVQTLVGNSLGSGKINLARAYAFETTKIATYYTLLVGIIFLAFPRIILGLITTNVQVIETGVPVLRVAAVAQIFYATGVVLANALQAAGKTFYVMLSEVFTNWILFIPLSYFMGVYLKAGLIGAWAALPVYIVMYSFLIYMKFRFGNWQSLKNL